MFKKIGLNKDISFDFNGFKVEIKRSELVKKIKEKKHDKSSKYWTLVEFIYHEFIKKELESNIENVINARTFFTHKKILRPLLEEEKPYSNDSYFMLPALMRYFDNSNLTYGFYNMPFINSFYTFSSSYFGEKYSSIDKDKINSNDGLESFIENLFGFSQNKSIIESNIKREDLVSIDILKEEKYPFNVKLSNSYKSDISISNYEEVNKVFDFVSFFELIKSKEIFFIEDDSRKSFKLEEYFQNEIDFYLFLRFSKYIKIENKTYRFDTANERLNLISLSEVE